ELYRDVDINQGRGLQVSQDIEDSHVTLTPVKPDGQQESSSVSSFVTSMLNPISDAGVVSIFTTASSPIAPLQTPTPIMTPSTIATITTSSDAPIPPTTIPSETNQFAEDVSNIPENDEFLRTIDENMKKIIKEQVKSQVKEQVLRILPRIEESVNAQLEAKVLTRSSHSLRTSYVVAADLTKMELKKSSLKRWKEINKTILESYGDTTILKRRRGDDDDQEGPSTGSDQGSKRRREGGEPESASTPFEPATKSASSTKRLRIRRSNFRLPSDIQSKEPTLQVVYDVLRGCPFFKAFLVTADVPSIYMQEFWATAYVHQYSIRFKIDSKKNIVDLEAFREMLHISPRVPGQSFDELPFEDEILDFLWFLGHSAQIKTLTDVNVNKLFQPWRSFAAVINKCLTGKSFGFDSFRDDILFSTIKVVSRHQNTQQYGAILHIELTTEDIRNTKAYKEYYACATREAAPKPKVSARRKIGGSDSSTTPPTAVASPRPITTVTAAPRLTVAAKGKQPARATSPNDLSEVERTEAEQLKIVLRRSRQETHISQHDGSSIDKGTGSKPGLPDVPSDDSEEEFSWNSSDDEDQESSSVSSFVNSMLNSISDAGVESIFTTASSPIAPIQTSTPIMTPSTIATITTSSDAPIPPTTIPSAIISFIKNFICSCSRSYRNRAKENPHGKMEGNKSIQRFDKQRNLYKALVDANEANKTILESYEDTAILKRRRGDDDDQEGPSAGSNRGSKRRKEGGEPESASTPSEPVTRSASRFTTGTQYRQMSASASRKKYTTSVTKTKAAYYGHIKWIEDLVPRTMWIQEPLNYDKHALWGVSHWGRKRQQFYGFAVNRESALDVYSKRRIIAVTDHKIVEWHNYKHLDWISVRCDDDKIYKFKEGDFKRLRLQDIKDMLLLLVQRKLSNLTVEECFAFNKRLNLTKPDTYRSDLKRREAYTAYSNPRGFIYQNKDKKNRLMQIDELHKFSDGTLNDVRNALDDRLKGIRMQYLSQTIWRKGDKERAAAMIQSIDNMLKTRRIMRSLEWFVGG
nr:hypothetical protein [Tanacetum cinerariifolium]